MTVDVDAALEGRYALKFTPRLPADLFQDGKITVELEVHGKVSEPADQSKHKRLRKLHSEGTARRRGKY